jgi:hypothetical protein
MFGWFKKKTVLLKEAFKDAEEFHEDKATEAMVESITKEPKKEKKHIDCECSECIRKIKHAKYK